MSYRYSTEYPGGRQVSAWVGWVVFAGVILVINGAITGLQGLAGIFRDESYFTGALGDGKLLVFDQTAWGWIHLILGILMVVIGALLFKGSTFARIIAVILVGINLIEQFVWIGAYPFWSLIIIALDMFIIYALVVHGGELKEPTPGV